MPTLHISSIISCSKATVRWKVENGVIIGHRNVNNHHIRIIYIIKLAPFEIFQDDWFILSGMTRPTGYSHHKFNSIFINKSAKYNSQLQIIKWGVSFQWSASLYCPMRNSDQMTIEKTNRTYKRYKWNDFWSLEVNQKRSACDQKDPRGTSDLSYSKIFYGPSFPGPRASAVQFYTLF